METFLTMLENLHLKNIMTSTSLVDAKKVNSLYPVLVSEHLFKQILKTNSNALARQFFPHPLEYNDSSGIGAFFPDEKHTTEILIQKYPNRCIIYTTSSCFANCRHCSRKEKWNDKYIFSKSEFDRACLEIKNSSFLEEVILTGGDTLTNNDEIIDYMLKKISEISHIKVIRIGTRAFTSFPQRITTSLCNILSKYNSLIVSTQFNHPDEFSDETIKALQMIQNTGIPILNQSVLLKEVNDSYSVMKELLMTCAHNRVIPYYLFHCFNVKGTLGFRTDVKTGIDIIDKLIGNVGGWWIPRYTVIPHTTGVKVPLCSNGIVENKDNKLFVKDFKGRIIQYE